MTIETSLSSPYTGLRGLERILRPAPNDLAGTAMVEHDAEVDARAAAETAAQLLGLPGELTLLAAGENHVYGCGEVVVRVAGPDVDVPSQLAAAYWLRARGIALPQPLSGVVALPGAQVVVWERLNAPPPHELNYRAFGQLIARLHALPVAEVPISLQRCTDEDWLDLDERLDQASHTDIASKADIAVLRRAMDEIGDWRALCDRAAPVLCHGDAHPLNVLMRGEQVVLADWDALCIGPVAWDHAPLMTWTHRWGGDPSAYNNFAAGYGVDLRDSALAQLLARLRLIGPTLTMIIRGATSAPHATEARRRLRYWHGEADAPVWTPQ